MTKHSPPPNDRDPLGLRVRPLRRGPPLTGARPVPVNPERARLVVELRDVHGMTFEQISETTAATSPLTRMGAWYIYRRWRAWAYGNAEPSQALFG